MEGRGGVGRGGGRRLEVTGGRATLQRESSIAVSVMYSRLVASQVFLSHSRAVHCLEGTR